MQKVKADFGAYVQDAWTMKRLTLNYGGRFDPSTPRCRRMLRPDRVGAVRPRLPGHQGCAELERLGDPHWLVPTTFSGLGRPR